MIVKEVRELIGGMEVSADTMLKAEGLLTGMADTEEVSEELLNEIMKIIDADFDPARVVEDSDKMPEL